MRTVLATVGGSFLGAVNQAQIYVRIAPHEERLFSLGRLLKETLKLQPWKAFQGNYAQRDVMGQVRQVIRKFPDLRGGPRNVQSFNFGGGPFEIDFSIHGPVLEDLARYTEELRKKAPEHRASSTPTPRSSSTARSCASRSTASARPTSASTPRTSPRRCA